MTQETVEVAMPSYLSILTVYYIISVIYMYFTIKNNPRYKFDKEDLEDYIHYYAILLSSPIFALSILIIKVLKHYKLNNKQIKK
tara:strand:- start:8974 stop:9225 length:252 start_codon:yes stop_codon:yes gene_type:complete